MMLRLALMCLSTGRRSFWCSWVDRAVDWWTWRRRCCAGLACQPDASDYSLKCLGAPANLIFRVYLLQVMLISSLGVCLGVVLAAIAPALALDILGAYITVPLTLSVYPIPLAIAAGFGLVTSFLLPFGP